jgi:putative endonuclease
MNRYYIGYTSDLEKRLNDHNTGISTFTAKAQDWKLLYNEAFDSREEAHQRELEIKKKKSRKYIEWLITKKS